MRLVEGVSGGDPHPLHLATIVDVDEVDVMPGIYPNGFKEEISVSHLQPWRVEDEHHLIPDFLLG
ncbi:MAG TPA: hypothetical protein ENL11_01980 [Candidatus Acetothermia bacterium]|nr:hypothetical protein [Candidatus Acetothermia bacterium]